MVRIDPVALVETCRANLAAIRDLHTGVDLARAAEEWEARLGEREWWRADDGNIVRVGGGRNGALLSGDHRGEAARFARRHLIDAASEASSVLVMVEGVDPPWILLEAARAFSPRPDGFTARLQVVQADPWEFLDGLAAADLREVLGTERTSVFVGSDASERLFAWTRERFETQLSGPVIRTRSLRTPSQPPVDGVLARARAEQLAEHARLVAEVAELYGQTGQEHKSTSAQEHSGTTGRPLRVLVPTSRFTTFVRHSSTDLVEAFRAAGHEAELLMEPDGSGRLSSLAYLRRIAACQPDAVVMINWTRSMLSMPLPRDLPFVSWMQDVMPQQFRAGAGEGEAGRAGVTEAASADWLIGNLHRELFESFGLSRERTMSFPVVASARKFHTGPVADDLRARFECEIAFVGHQSEPVEMLHARLVSEARESGGGAAAEVLERLRPAVEGVARAPERAGLLHDRLEGRARAALRPCGLGRGGQPDEREVSRLVRSYAVPLAERVIRHQTLEWAGEIAARRGWRFRLLGRGWAEHPTLGQFAKENAEGAERRGAEGGKERGEGGLEHGEGLRAAYACAAVHLHASITAMVHQRVMECALSGGLPLCRLARWELVPADAPEYDAAWLLGRNDLVFRSAAELETLIERSIGDPAWRAARSAAIAARVRERLTHDVLVARLCERLGAAQAGAGGSDQAIRPATGTPLPSLVT